MSKKLNVSGLFSSDPLPEEAPKSTHEEVKEERHRKVKREKAKNDPKSKAQVIETKQENIEAEDENATSVSLSLNLGKIKKKKPIDYISFKLKRDVHNQLGRIAKKENIDYTGNLIHLILEDFIKQYNGKE